MFSGDLKWDRKAAMVERLASVSREDLLNLLDNDIMCKDKAKRVSKPCFDTYMHHLALIMTALSQCCSVAFTRAPRTRHDYPVVHHVYFVFVTSTHGDVGISCFCAFHFQAVALFLKTHFRTSCGAAQMNVMVYGKDHPRPALTSEGDER